MMKWMIFFFVPTLITVSAFCHAVDESRLWLPVKYQMLHLSLLKAASVAEEVERCVTVVEGTLDLEQSRPEHPIFRILCRQNNGRTYNEMVDGLNFATLTTPKVVEREPTPEEIERLRIEEEERQRQEIVAQKLNAWQQCKTQLIERTRLMLDLVWLVDMELPMEPQSFSPDEIRFSVRFDARSMWREPLHYIGECVIREGVLQVSLNKR